MSVMCWLLAFTQTWWMESWRHQKCGRNLWHVFLIPGLYFSHHFFLSFFPSVQFPFWQRARLTFAITIVYGNGTSIYYELMQIVLFNKTNMCNEYPILLRWFHLSDILVFISFIFGRKSLVYDEIYSFFSVEVRFVLNQMEGTKTPWSEEMVVFAAVAYWISCLSFYLNYVWFET